MSALSAALLIFSFQFSLLFFDVWVARRTIGFNTQYRTSEIFQRFTHAHTDSRLYFHNAHNQCRISGRKSALYWRQKQNTFWHL